jgi:3-oxoadipate enol-lactonase
VPVGGEALLERAAPAFEAYTSGDHGASLAMFLSGVSGLDWTTCAHCSKSVLPARSRRRIADADTFFGIELPSLTVWAFDAERVATIQQPVLSVLGTETEPLWLEVAFVIITGRRGLSR